MTDHQVLVVGAGLVGATCALALADAGFAVAVVDRNEPQRNCGALGIDIRNVALSPASAALLDSVGVWPDEGLAPYERMYVWEQWGSGVLDFQAAEVGRTELGWLVEASALTVNAWQALTAHPRITICLGELEALDETADGIELKLAGGAAVSGEFLVAADGARSFVRQALNVPVRSLAVDQVALATVVRTAEPHANTAWQRFLTDGPLAFLPAPDPHVCSIVWSQSGDSAERRLAMDDAAFCAEIGHAIEHRLGEVVAVDQRLSFPLVQQRVEQCVPAPRVVLIGDAMRTIHPLAGLGVNLGLEDVQALMDVARGQASLAEPALWARFARQRQARSELMMQIMANLQRLFGQTNPLMTLLRNVGVQTFNSLDMVKHQIMREAMGLQAGGI